jgi:hypothetical protein
MLVCPHVTTEESLNGFLLILIMTSSKIPVWTQTDNYIEHYTEEEYVSVYNMNVPC